MISKLEAVVVKGVSLMSLLTSFNYNLIMSYRKHGNEHEGQRRMFMLVKTSNKVLKFEPTTSNTANS